MEKFYKDFPCKFTPALVLHVLYFKGDFLYKPRARLARAAFKRDFLVNLKAISFFGSKLRKVKFKRISFKTCFDPRYRPPTPVLVNEVK